MPPHDMSAAAEKFLVVRRFMPPADQVPPPDGPEEFGLPSDGSALASSELPQPEPLPLINASSWEGQPVPQREWRARRLAPG
jgi:hypothetical protein